MKPLNTALQAELALYLKTWNFHWNVEGPLFPSLHKLFEEQYDGLQELVDEIAERIRALGGVADTSVKLELTGQSAAKAMLESLAADHEALSAKMSSKWIPALEKAGDPGSVDLLTRALQEHDKMAWMLRATAK